MEKQYHCWICMRVLALPAVRVKPFPFWENICQTCWNALPPEKRLEFSARFTPLDEGGFGELEQGQQLTRAIRRALSEFRRAFGAARRATENLENEPDDEDGADFWKR